MRITNRVRIVTYFKAGKSVSTISWHLGVTWQYVEKVIRETMIEQSRLVPRKCAMRSAIPQCRSR